MHRVLAALLVSLLLASVPVASQIYYPPPYRLPRTPAPHPQKAPQYKGDKKVNRTLHDLQALEYPVLTKDQRKTAEKSIKDLQEFRKKRYEGKFDNKRIDRVLQALDQLATSPNFTDRDRDRLAADIKALHSFQELQTGVKASTP